MNLSVTSTLTRLPFRQARIASTLRSPPATPIDARRLFQLLERYGDDPIVERPMHRRAVAIEELQGNVADCALLCEILQLSPL